MDFHQITSRQYSICVSTIFYLLCCRIRKRVMKQKYIGKPKDILIKIVVLRQYHFERSNFCMHFFCGKIITQTEEVRPAFGSLPKPFIIGVCVSQRLCCAFAIGNNTCRDLHSVVWCGIKPWCIRYIKSSK